MKDRILIVDDTLDICRILKRYLDKQGYDVAYVTKAKLAMEKILEKEYDLLICDYRLPDFDGIEVLNYLKKKQPRAGFIMITGYTDVNVAVEAIKLGADDYVAKPLIHEEINMSIKDALEKRRDKFNHSALSSKDGQSWKGESNNAEELTDQADQTTFEFGSSAFAQKLHEHIGIVAPTDMSVLITGETGTGKEFVARAIHSQSQRSNQPFVAVDCGALTDTMASSELFGHVKGAFTDASSDKTGLITKASGGTLFLDEVGNLSAENQQKLLRSIQESTIRRMGSEKKETVDVRILAATNEAIQPGDEDSTFRKDLYYRLNEFQIRLLPLRERREDIAFFANKFLQKANSTLNKQVSAFSPQALHFIREHHWTGNLRELRNVIKRTVLFTKGELVQADALPSYLKGEESFLPGNTTGNRGTSKFNLKSAADNAEREVICQALKHTKGNKSETAKLLNVDRKTLYNKIHSLGLDDWEPKALSD